MCLQGLPLNGEPYNAHHQYSIDELLRNTGSVPCCLLSESTRKNIYNAINHLQAVMDWEHVRYTLRIYARGWCDLFCFCDTISSDIFTHILQGWFNATEAIIWLINARQVTLKGMYKIDTCLTKTKQYIFLRTCGKNSHIGRGLSHTTDITRM